MSLNQGTLDALINASTSGPEIDGGKLAEALFKISDKLFGIHESPGGEADIELDKPLTGKARGVIFPVISIDANGVVHFGLNANLNGISHVSIPRVAAAQLPAGSQAMNGVIVIDSTNNRLVYYTNNLRYWIPIGTIF